MPALSSRKSSRSRFFLCDAILDPVVHEFQRRLLGLTDAGRLLGELNHLRTEEHARGVLSRRHPDDVDEVGQLRLARARQ